jgi:hypothetical protein
MRRELSESAALDFLAAFSDDVVDMSFGDIDKEQAWSYGVRALEILGMKPADWDAVA